MEGKHIDGFSKLSKSQKIKWLADQFSTDPAGLRQDLEQYWLPDHELQRIHDGFSENTVSNFLLPYGIVPNVKVNDRIYAVPMVIEESSVVAAASSSAKFWLEHGGFKCQIIGTEKIGQLHFNFTGDPERLKAVFPSFEPQLIARTADLTRNMKRRGGGVIRMELLDFTAVEANYYQLRVHFETCDSMGANFINSILESYGHHLVELAAEHPDLDGKLTVIMAILSNFTPLSKVRATVSCSVSALENCSAEYDGREFAARFAQAVRIAEIDSYRATTHNKGIYNGVDAVILATGNDFRAVEAAGHTYASKNGRYSSLSHCELVDDQFTFWLDLPLAIGTVGGLTKLHPLAKRTLDILGNPSARELMMIIAAVGLAQNFAAVRSLVTTGIQQGHMKMHLSNILIHLGASSVETEDALRYFADKAVTFTAVRSFLADNRTTIGVAKK